MLLMHLVKMAFPELFCNQNFIWDGPVCSVTVLSQLFGPSNVANGLWSVTKRNLLPYKYWWNFFTPNIVLSASFSICAVITLALDSVRKAWAIGRSSPEGKTCAITASMPYCEASVSSFNGNFSSKCVKTGALDNLCFSWSNTFCWSVDHFHLNPSVFRLTDGW